MKNSITAILISLFCLIGRLNCSAQRYDLFYTCENNTYYNEDISNLEAKNGYVSIDIDNKTIIFHNIKDSEVVDFKKADYNESSRQWRLKLPKAAGDSWDGYVLSLDYKQEPVKLERCYTMRGEPKYHLSSVKAMYKYPPFWLNKDMFATCKDVPAAGDAIPDLRGDEYACFSEIINSPKKDGYVLVTHSGDELLIDETDLAGAARPRFRIMLDPESILLVSKPKHHGVYFNGVDKDDSSVTYEVFYGVNKHLDMLHSLLQVMEYKAGVYQKMRFYGYLYADQNNEKNYTPYVPPVISGCQRCRGTGQVVSAEICKRCHGRGHQKSTIYRASDQIVKTEIHNDGSRTITYLKQGFSSSYYDCELCKGTGHKLKPCPVCGGTGKIKTPGR